MSASNLVASSLLIHFALASNASHNSAVYIRLSLAVSGIALCSVRQYYCYLNCKLSTSSGDDSGGSTEKPRGSKIDWTVHASCTSFMILGAKRHRLLRERRAMRKPSVYSGTCTGDLGSSKGQCSSFCEYPVLCLETETIIDSNTSYTKH
jgi:hypothetical protein